MGNSSSSHLKKQWLTPITIGRNVPYVNFILRIRNDSGDENPFEFKTMSTEDLFKGKRVVLFALPGAFTPTCSSKHLPGYVEDADEIKSMGVDEIFCLSVNDAYVMRQWGLKEGMVEEKVPGEICFNKVKFLPDGNAYFTRGMGLSCKFSDLGFGERSWRYSVVINDMKVEKIFIENNGTVTQNPDNDPYEISDSKTMLAYLKEWKELEDVEEKIEEKAVIPEPKDEEEKKDGDKVKDEVPPAVEEPKAEEAPVTEEEAKPEVETAPKEEEAKPEEETAPKEEEAKPEEEAATKEEEVKPEEEEAKPEEETAPKEEEETKPEEDTTANATEEKVDEPKAEEEAN